jgi:hypothetical protein
MFEIMIILDYFIPFLNLNVLAVKRSVQVIDFHLGYIAMYGSTIFYQKNVQPPRGDLGQVCFWVKKPYVPAHSENMFRLKGNVVRILCFY